MRLGSLINCSCEAAQTSHKLNVKGPGAFGTLMTLAQRKKTVHNNQEDFVFTGPPGVKQSVLSPDNVWYCWLKLLFSMTVKIDSLYVSSVPTSPSVKKSS